MSSFGKEKGQPKLHSDNKLELPSLNLDRAKSVRTEKGILVDQEKVGGKFLLNKTLNLVELAQNLGLQLLFGNPMGGFLFLQGFNVEMETNPNITNELGEEYTTVHVDMGDDVLYITFDPNHSADKAYCVVLKNKEVEQTEISDWHKWQAGKNDHIRKRMAEDDDVTRSNITSGWPWKKGN